MSPETARSLLTHENITITCSTLAALDALQGNDYSLHYDQKVRAEFPHSESNLLQDAKLSLHSFTLQCLPGNSVGVKMLTSAFINGLGMVGMKKEVELALEACEPSSTHE